MILKFLSAALVLLAMSLPLPASAQPGEAKLLQLLSTPDHFAIMRHSTAPGIGDPDRFDLRQCNTQRNLNAAGRAQARRIGERFRKAGIGKADIYSSQWCRCLETAELLQLGPVLSLASLNSFFDLSRNRNAQTQTLRNYLAGAALDKPTVLVTHQVNITALTGVYPSAGEIVIVKRSGKGGLSVIGTVSPPGGTGSG